MNWTGNKFERPFFDDPYLAPVENVILEFNIPNDKMIKSVFTFVDTPIKTITGAKKVKVQIPRIESYEGIQFNFEWFNILYYMDKELFPVSQILLM